MQFLEIELRKTNAQKFPNESKCSLKIRSGKVRPLRVLWKYFLNHCSLDYFSNAKFLWPISKYGVKGSAECYESLSGTYHTYSPESFSRMHTAREKKLNMCTEQTSPLLCLSKIVCLPIPQMQHIYNCVKKRSNIKFKNFNF